MIQGCEQATGMDNDRFWRDLSRRVIDRRIPFTGSLALTHRCNLACAHCYAREEAAASGELTTGQWRQAIDAVKEAGCLYLLLTGGEPLLRADFPLVYRHAKESGFLVTVFTNGTRVDAAILDLFRELPPYLVEISLYGASAAVHDRITGVPGSFQRTRQAIEALLAQGIHVRLKSVLMTLNHDDFPAIENLARSLGVKFRFDPGIFPALNGDNGPVALRVPPARAVNLEMADPAREREWREFLAQFDGARAEEGLYNCGSGLNTFHVDPQGWVYPCLMVRHARFSLRASSFREGWEKAFNDFRKVAAPGGLPCRGCDKKLLCGYCPGFFAMENGSESFPSEYMCRIGHLRYEHIYHRVQGE